MLSSSAEKLQGLCQYEGFDRMPILNSLKPLCITVPYEEDDGPLGMQPAYLTPLHE